MTNPTMEKALQNLKKEVASFAPNAQIPDTEVKNFLQNTTVALMAGGKGQRFSEVAGAKNVNKNAFKLPNGDTMIEMTIRMYRDAGVKNFAALVFHKADSIIDILGDGSKLGVNINYSYDPEQPVGKGGAVLNALLNNTIPRTQNLIVHNPDDVIVDYRGSFPEEIVKGHLSGTKGSRLASIVIVSEVPHPYTGMTIRDSLVEGIEMYPVLPIPSHIGVTVFSPEVYPYFEELFSLTEKKDFEKVLFPVLSEKKLLHAVEVPTENWIAVNNAKALQELVDKLTK